MNVRFQLARLAYGFSVIISKACTRNAGCDWPNGWQHWWRCC